MGGQVATAASDRAREAADSIEQLFDLHYERLVQSLSVAAGNREVARDAVQDAFVQAHLHRRRIAGYDDPAAWIRRVAVNRILNHHRSAGRGIRAIQRLGGVLDAYSDPVVDHVDLQRALVSLTLRQRLAVALHYLEGLTIDEAAVVMEVSSGTVKTHLSRARDVLRALLEVTDG
jgi:RNA polymerase sigma factor (sigma-70 family)